MSGSEWSSYDLSSSSPPPARGTNGTYTTTSSGSYSLFDVEFSGALSPAVLKTSGVNGGSGVKSKGEKVFANPTLSQTTESSSSSTSDTNNAQQRYTASQTRGGKHAESAAGVGRGSTSSSSGSDRVVKRRSSEKGVSEPVPKGHELDTSRLHKPMSERGGNLMVSSSASSETDSDANSFHPEDLQERQPSEVAMRAAALAGGPTESESDSDTHLFELKLPKLYYFRLHVLYLIGMAFLGTFTLFFIEMGQSDMPFIDAMFTAVSAVCVTGLVTIDFSKLTFGAQFVTALLIFSGGITLTTYPTLILKRKRILFKRYTSACTSADLRFYDNEYDALGKLLIVIPAIMSCAMISAFLMLALYLQFRPLAHKRLGGYSPWGFSLFHTVSAVNNAGFALFPDSLTSYQSDFLVNFVIGGLIIIGNTGFPVLLMGVLWTLKKVSQYDSHQYRYLIENPRWYILLFPSHQTKIFAIFSAVLLIPCAIVFLIAEADNKTLDNMTTATYVLAACFHAVSTRTAGFNTVAVGSLHPATLMVTLVLMYIRPYPAIGAKKGEKTADNYQELVNSLHLHTKKMLYRNGIWLYLSIVFILLVERRMLGVCESSTFRVIFEVISAFGNVGLSMGTDGKNYSFVGSMTVVSKLVIMVVMLMGRNRGLEAALKDMEAEEREREEEKRRRDREMRELAEKRYVRSELLGRHQYHLTESIMAGTSASNVLSMMRLKRRRWSLQ